MRAANLSHPKVMDHLQEPDTNVSFFSGLTNMIKSATTWVHTPEAVERTSKPSHRASPYSIKNRPTKASSRVANRTPSPACSFISEMNSTPSVPSLSHSPSPPSQSQTHHLPPESNNSSQTPQPPQTHSDGIHCYMDRPTIFVSSSQPGKIPKPPGEVGRPNRGGYNLFVYLGWPKRDYDAVRAFVKKLLLERLDCEVCFTKHLSESPHEINHIREQVNTKYDFLLNAYEESWVVDDFIRTQLKYLRVRSKLSTLKLEAARYVKEKEEAC